MRKKNSIKRRFILVLVAFICLSLLGLAGCGGGGGSGDSGGDSGDDSGDDGGTPTNSYTELDVSFGGVVVDLFADQTVSLINAGTVNLTLGQIEDPGAPFTIESDECSGVTLGPSGTCDIQVRFSPTDSGSYSDTFVVPLSGSDTNFAGVNLEGDGLLYDVSINQIDAGDCPDIRLLVSVTDSSYDFVPDMNENNFVLTENSTQIDHSALAVSQGSNPNLSVVLALDTSGSVDSVIYDIIAAAEGFINGMGDYDEAAVFKFAADGAEQVSDSGFTTTDSDGKTALIAAIEANITYIGGSTALFTAISDISAYIEANATPGNRLAIVVISDGVDTASALDLDDAVAAANGVGAPVITIGAGAENATDLQDLADGTGGQYYGAPDSDMLDEIYPKVLALFFNQYVIEYTSEVGHDSPTALSVEVVSDNELLGQDSKEYECAD